MIPFEAAFRQWSVEDYLADEIRLCILNDSIALTNLLAAPHFGGTGLTTDLSAAETIGGNFPANGFLLTSKTFLGSPPLADLANLPQVAQDPANPTDIRYGVIVNFTRTDRVIYGFFDYGAQDASSGPVDLNFPNGLFTMDGNDT